MLVNQFNGGLATRQDPQYLQVNQAVVYENVDNSKGSLTPTKRPLAVNIPSITNNYPFWHEARQQWIPGTGSYIPRTELATAVYEATSSGIIVRSLISDRLTGVAKPDAPAVTAQLAPGKIASATLTPASSSSTAALPAGTYSYLLVNKNQYGCSPGLSAQVTATGRSSISIGDYYRSPGDIRLDRNFRLEEQSTFASTGAYQTVTIGPVAAVIDPAYGLEVYRLFKGKHYKVGVLTTFDDTVVDNIFDISANAEFDKSEFAPLKGVYQYVVTHVNSEGIESQPSEVSAEVDLADGGGVSLSLTTSFAGTARIYRVGGSLTSFSLVAEIPSDSSSYLDILSDVDIDGRILTSQENARAPTSMSSLVSAYGMLFGAKDNNLRYTNPGEPEYWPEAYSIPFPTAITGLAPVSTGILVMTKTRVYLVTGSGPLVLSVQLLRGDLGCEDPKSVQLVQGNAIWASAYGICASSGSGVDLISQDLLGLFSFTDIRSSAFVDEVYYISYDTNKVLAVDFRFNSLIFKTLDFGLGTTSITFFQDTDTLYIYTGTDQKYLPFGGTLNSVLKYKSPRFIEGRATENKTYKKISFYVEGSVQLKVYINDELVASKTTAADTKDSIELQVPQQLQRGFFIQFEIEGTGKVYEYEYVANGKQN